jgi:myo-inositol 2-dehydrogenase/D-chiro-inositol 1-dehydrogenase
MSNKKRGVSRRHFLQGSAAGVAAITIVPRHVLGGAGEVPPSDVLRAGLIGCGGQGGEDLRSYITRYGGEFQLVARCDVKYRDRVDNERYYTDFRPMLERKDIDVISVATPPGWHATASIAAMEAGKDVLCEKPMTRFIAEGRAVVNAERRFGRIFYLGTGGRLGGKTSSPEAILTHKIMASGLLEPCEAVHIKRGGLKVKMWSGMVRFGKEEIPSSLDWDMYCGPAPPRPFIRHRTGGTHRGYWDYEGGGMADMGQHHFAPEQWIYAKDDTSPVEIEAHAPPAHPEACGMWGWVELKYADGLTFVMDSGEWGPRYDRKQPRSVSLSDLSEEDQKKIQAMPDPEPRRNFVEAVKTRKQAANHAEAAHRSVTILHLGNIAIRTGRKIQYDPVREQIIGDEEANRLVYQPMRAPWRP